MCKVEPGQGEAWTRWLMAQTMSAESGQEPFPEGYSTVRPGHSPGPTLIFFFFPMARKEPLFQSPGLLTVTVVCDQMQGISPLTLFSSWAT